MIEGHPTEPRHLKILVVGLFIGSLALSFTFYYALFVTVAPLFGRLPPKPLDNMDGEESQPFPTHPLDLTIGILRGTANQVIAWVSSEEFLRLFLVLSLTIVFLNELSYIPLGWLHRYVSEKFRNKMPTRSPPVSIVIPAYNEEKTIGYTLETLLNTDYPNKQVIVVNDGSTDHTKWKVMPYAIQGKVHLMDRPNGGKAVAITTGLLAADGDIIVVMDADGAVERDAIKWIVSHFEDPNVIAVSGNPKVGNRHVNLLTGLQALDYVRGVNLRRRAFDLLNTLDCVPGCIGAFRKRIYDEIGTYDVDTLVEDMDVTVKFIKTRGMVRQENRAIVHTESPETLHGFVRQRIRWYAGGLQAVLKHRHHWWRFGALSFLGYPYLIAGMTFVPVFELLLIALSIIQILAGLWVFQILYWSSIAVLDIAFSISAVLLDKEDWRLVLYSPVHAILYRHFNDLIRLKSYWDLARGKLEWRRTRAERRGLESKIMI